MKKWINISMFTLMTLGITVVSQASSGIQELLTKAKRGDGTAAHGLGIAYITGNGVQQNEKEAFRWFLAGANAGNVDAMFSVGSMYLKGRGVPLDKAKAEYYFSLACNNGMQAGCESAQTLAQKRTSGGRDTSKHIPQIFEGDWGDCDSPYESYSINPRKNTLVMGSEDSMNTIKIVRFISLSAEHFSAEVTETVNSVHSGKHVSKSVIKVSLGNQYLQNGQKPIVIYINDQAYFRCK